jgi:hypothetical protein
MYVKNTPNQFTNVDMVVHKKEIGINSDMTPQQQAMMMEKKKPKRERVVDDEGFEMIK